MTPAADVDAVRIVVFSGAGGGVPDLRAFAATSTDFARFAPMTYPGWRRYADKQFSAEDLIGELANEIASKIREGSVAILGVSLGGHIGYAVALRLESLGMKVAGLCVVDSFIFSSTEIRPGSAGRYIARVLELARGGSLGQVWRLIRSLFWRALLRLAGDRTLPWLERWRDSRVFQTLSRIDSLLEEELSMRLLLRNVAPWLSSLDSDPAPLLAPAAHLRTSGTADDDSAWRARCPNIDILEISGDHEGLLDPSNFARLRQAFARATRGWWATPIRIDV